MSKKCVFSVLFRVSPRKWRDSYLFTCINFKSQTSRAAGAQASQPAAAASAAAAATQVSPRPAQPRLQPQASKKSPSRNSQQLNFLLERQKEFKLAALKAKKQGDIEAAKNYLRMSKVIGAMCLGSFTLGLSEIRQKTQRCRKNAYEDLENAYYL